MIFYRKFSFFLNENGLNFNFNRRIEALTCSCINETLGAQYLQWQNSFKSFQVDWMIFLKAKASIWSYKPKLQLQRSLKLKLH